MSVRAVVWAVILVVVGGCDDGSAGGGTQIDVDYDASYECCLNGAFYTCADSEAVSDCGQGDPSGCTRDGEC